MHFWIMESIVYVWSVLRRNNLNRPSVIQQHKYFQNQIKSIPLKGEKYELNFP